MMRMIKIEFQKLFENPRFYLSVLGIAASLLLNALDIMRYADYITADDLFHNTTNAAFILICFVLCIVGGGFSFCVEQKNGCIRYQILRCNVKTYSISKVTVSFIGGYLTALFGCILGECSMAVVLWCRYRDWSKVFSGFEAVQLNVCFIVIFALLCGILSVLALLVTIVMPDFFVAMSMPILIYYMWLNVTGWLEGIFPVWLDIAVIYSVWYQAYEFAVFISDFGYALLVALCLVFCMWIFIHRGVKWRVENG